jgi:phenylacetate-CoA ligase
MNTATERSLERLADKLHMMAGASDYYQKRIPKECVDRPLTVESLRTIPMMTKDEVIGLQAADKPFGPLIADRSEAIERVFVAPGPVYFPYSKSDWQATARVGAEQWLMAGVKPGDIVDISAGYHWAIGGTVADAAMRALGATVVPGGPGMTDLRLQVMMDTGITVFQAFTPYAEQVGARLSELDDEQRSKIKVRLLLIGGELRSAESKRVLSSAWNGVRIVESYGLAETGGLVAMECQASGDWMHVSEQIIVELLDPDTGEPAAAGSPGEIVVSELIRKMMPMIRFRTGDITEGLQIGKCECGLTTSRIGRILGRRSSIPRVRGLFLSPYEIADVLSRVNGLGKFQIVIDRPGRIDELTIKIEAVDHLRTADVSKSLSSQLQDRVRVSPVVELVAPGSLELSELPFSVLDRRRL